MGIADDIIGANLGFDVIGADLPFITKPNESWDVQNFDGTSWHYLGRGVRADLDPLGSSRGFIFIGRGYSFMRPTSLTQPSDQNYRLTADNRPAGPVKIPTNNEDSGEPVQSFDVWALSQNAFAYLGRGPLSELNLGGINATRLDPLGQPIMIRATGLLPGSPGFRFDAQGKPV